MDRRACLATLALVGLPAWSQQKTPREIEDELPGAGLRGSGRLTFFGLEVYDARLWVAEGFQPQRFEQQPLALELAYARTLYGRLIAERSLAEMKRTGSIDEGTGERWLAEMKRLFPDVARGDRLTGVYRPQESARFYFNGGLRGELRDAEFARRFFAIWLGPQTSEPALRQSLLGTTRAAT